MKNLFFAAIGLIGLTAATLPTPTPVTTPAPTAKPGAYTIDVSKSTFKWTGKKVSGSHWGYVKFSNGTITTDGNTLKGGSFTVDMNTIDCQDLQGEWGGKLVGHLKNDDFFGVDKFPTSTLVIKTATAKGDNKYDVVADLTIKGKTNEVTFPATVAVVGGQLTATADFNVNRTLYDIRYGSGSFFSNLGDKTINDDFTVSVNLVANGVAPAAAPEKTAAPKKGKKTKPKKAAVKN